jgi:hypothetical protein
MPTPPPPSDPLDPLLSRWRATAPEPSDSLEPLVWRRIAAKAISRPARASLPAAIETLFARTSFTAVFVAACVLLGLFLAETRVSRLQAKRSGEFVLSYLRQIDPQFEATAPAVAAPGANPTRP